MERKRLFRNINARTKQIMRLNKALLDDIEKNISDKLNIEKSATKLSKPYLNYSW